MGDMEDMGSNGQFPDEGIGLAAALSAIRHELSAAVREADGDTGTAVRLGVESVELELQTTLSRSKDVHGGIKIHVISAGGDVKWDNSQIQTLRLKLGAVSATDGGTVRAGSAVSGPPRR